MIKNNDIFIFDVDGTLLKPSGNKIDRKGIEAINIASQLGSVVLASARPLQGIINLYTESEIKVDYIIALNGGLITAKPDIVKTIPIQPNVISYFMLHSNTFQNLWLFTADRWFSNNLTSPEYYVEQKAVMFDGTCLEKYNQEPVLKITIVTEKDVGEIHSISSEIEITTSNPNYIEIQSVYTNKFLASKKMFKDDVRIFSFGDSNNDYELLKNSFFSCAVANATAHIKSISKFISEFNYGEGALDSVNFVAKRFFN